MGLSEPILNLALGVQLLEEIHHWGLRDSDTEIIPRKLRNLMIWREGSKSKAGLKL